MVRPSAEPTISYIIGEENTTPQSDPPPGVANGFIPLRLVDIPSLTSEQFEAVFPASRRHAFLRELVRLVQSGGGSDGKS